MFNKKKKGLNNFVNTMIGVMVGIIVGVAVVIPVVNETITAANITGTTGTILGYLALLIAVVLFAGVANLL